MNATVVSTICSVLAPSSVACLGNAAARWQAEFSSFGVPPATAGTAALTLVDDDGLLDAAAVLASASGVVALRVSELPRLREWIPSWSLLRFRRRFLHDVPQLIVLQRQDADDWVEEYEHHIATLERESRARGLVNVETQVRFLEVERQLQRSAIAELVSRQAEREVLSEARSAILSLRGEIRGLEARLAYFEAHSTMRRVFVGISELRRRWAPSASLRTAAFDAMLSGIAFGQRAALRLLDGRDALLDHVRAPRT